MGVDSLCCAGIATAGKEKPALDSRTVSRVEAALTHRSDRARRGWQWDIASILLLVLAAVALIVVFLGGIPTGADPGNWLAVSTERLGIEVMSAEVGYPPLFPGTLAALLLVFDPLAAFNVIAVIAVSSLALALYVVSRTMGRVLALASALIAGTAGAQTDAFAWGGYPQILATSFGLLGAFMLVRYYGSRNKIQLAAGLVFIALTLATHAMVGGLVGIAVGVGAMHWSFMIPSSDGRKRAMVIGSSVATLAVLFTVLSVLMSTGGQEAVLNPLDESRAQSLVHATREAPLPWLLLTVVGLATLVARRWPAPVAATIATASGWAVAGLGFFVMTGEPRALLIVQVGVVILGVVGFGSLIEYLRRANRARHSRGAGRRFGLRLTTLVGVSMFMGLVVGGLGAYSAAVDWYRLVGEDEIASLDALGSHSEPGDLVIASIGVNGMPVGWWVEGYGRRPALSGHDPNFLAFPEEREQAQIANTFFGGELTLEESQAVLAETGVKFVAVDRRGPNASWLDSESARALENVDVDSNIVILRVPDER